MSTGTTIAKKPIRQVASVRELLVNESAKGQLAAVAAKHMSPDRLMRVTANAIRTTPKLQEAEPVSFLGALMQCAALGLEPNTVLGHAFLVPFRNNRKGYYEVQVIVGYKGLIDLARRSGHIRSISAHIHYSDDPVWVYREGADPRLEHEPGDQEGEKLHAYAVAHFREDMGDGFAHIVLPWKHVMRIRDNSENWRSAVKFNRTEKSPWHTHEDAMAKKTAIRALAKYLPLSVEFRDAVAVDHDGGTRADFAAFALDPGAGVTIDGEVAEPEPEPETEPESDPETEAPQLSRKEKQAKFRRETAAAKKGARTKQSAESEPVEPETDEDASEDGAIPEQFASVIARVKGDLAEAADSGEVEGTLDLFSDVIDGLRESCPAAYERVQEIADEARERVAEAG